MEPEAVAMGGAGAGAAAAAAAASNIFTFMGHSCSTGNQRYVPPGCMLVNLAECGDVSYVSLRSPFRIFLEMFENPVDQLLLADPITNKVAIEAKLGLKININYPGAPTVENKRYMDTLFSAQLYHKHDPGVFILNKVQNRTEQKYDIYPSGLYRSGTIKLEPLFKNVKNINVNIRDDLDYMYPIQVLYPKRKDAIGMGERLFGIVGKNFKVFDNIGVSFKILQSELFAKFPGVHYLITCRSPCYPDPLTKFRIDLRRSESRGHEDILNYLHNPSLAAPEYKVHQGEIGQKYRLPQGISSTNYIYYADRSPHLLGANADGREIIEIVRRGGSRKRRSKGSRKNKYTRK